MNLLPERTQRDGIGTNGPLNGEPTPLTHGPILYRLVKN